MIELEDNPFYYLDNGLFECYLYMKKPFIGYTNMWGLN